MGILKVILSFTSKTHLCTCDCEVKEEMYPKRYLREEELLSELQKVLEDNSDGGELFSDDSEDEFLPQATREVVDESSNSDDTDSSDVEDENSQSNQGDACIRGEEPVPTSSLDIVHRNVAPDGTIWFEAVPNSQGGRLPIHNILRESPGPTPHAKRTVSDESVKSAWHLFIDHSILKHIEKCTTTEAHRVLGNNKWSISTEELEAFIAIIYARGVSGCRTTDLHSLWSDSWGLPFCRETMSRNRFCEIMRFLRFDEKSTRSVRLQTDKFALVSAVWNKFVENCIVCYKPGPNITIDEQLFPSKTRCPFTQFMASKPDKYGQKYWLAVDVDTKYVLNGFPYLGKDSARSQTERVSDYVVMRLMEPFLSKGRNVTTDNYFTSLKLAEKLKAKSTSIVGTMNRARREIPSSVKTSKAPLYSTKVLKHDDVSLTVYQGKKAKNVLVMSSLHPTVAIDTNAKKIPETVSYYNKTKFGVDIVDKMARQYSVKASSRRWPVHSFYNVLDLAGINAYVLFRSITGKKVKRREYLQQLAEELRLEYLKRRPRPRTTGDNEGNEDEIEEEMTPKRRKCQILKFCKCNKTTSKCIVCTKMVCGKCTKKIQYKCVNCTEG